MNHKKELLRGPWVEPRPRVRIAEEVHDPVVSFAALSVPGGKGLGVYGVYRSYRVDIGL